MLFAQTWLRYICILNQIPERERERKSENERVREREKEREKET